MEYTPGKDLGKSVGGSLEPFVLEIPGLEAGTEFWDFSLEVSKN